MIPSLPECRSGSDVAKVTFLTKLEYINMTVATSDNTHVSEVKPETPSVVNALF